MPKSRSLSLTRRGFVAAGGALGLVAVLAACGGTDSAKGDGGKDNGASASSGPWTFTDDLKQEVTLKSKPKNIVAFTGTAAALYDYGVQVKGVFGPTKTADGKPDVQAGSMDISKVEILGNVYDEFNVEKYAASSPSCSSPTPGTARSGTSPPPPRTRSPSWPRPPRSAWAATSPWTRPWSAPRTSPRRWAPT